MNKSILLFLLAGTSVLACQTTDNGSSSNDEPYPPPQRTPTMSDACWQYCEPYVSYFGEQSMMGTNEPVTSETCEAQFCVPYEVPGCEVEAERYLRCGGQYWSNVIHPTPYDADCTGLEDELAAQKCATVHTTECDVARDDQCHCTAMLPRFDLVEVTCIATGDVGGGGAGGGGGGAADGGGSNIGGAGPYIQGPVQCACVWLDEVQTLCFQDELACEPVGSCCFRNLWP